MISVGCAILGIWLSSLLRLTLPPLWRMHLADLLGSEWVDGPLNCEGSGFVGPLSTLLSLEGEKESSRRASCEGGRGRGGGGGHRRALKAAVAATGRGGRGMWDGWENIWEGSPKARVQSQLSEACN